MLPDRDAVDVGAADVVVKVDVGAADVVVKVPESQRNHHTVVISSSVFFNICQHDVMSFTI